MNVLMIQSYMGKYDKVEVVRYEGKSKWIDCYKYFYYVDNPDIQSIVDNVEFGNVIFEVERITAITRIKN